MVPRFLTWLILCKQLNVVIIIINVTFRLFSSLKSFLLFFFLLHFIFSLLSTVMYPIMNELFFCSCMHFLSNERDEKRKKNSENSEIIDTDLLLTRLLFGSHFFCLPLFLLLLLHWDVFVISQCDWKAL